MEQSALIKEIASSPSATVTRATPYQSKAASRRIVSAEEQNTTADVTGYARQILRLHVLARMDTQAWGTAVCLQSAYRTGLYVMIGARAYMDPMRSRIVSVSKRMQGSCVKSALPSPPSLGLTANQMSASAI